MTGVSDPLPFLNTDASLVITIVALIALWYALRKSERGTRIFLWVVGVVVAFTMIHWALWGTCGRWGPWNEDFCTEPREDPW